MLRTQKTLLSGLYLKVKDKPLSPKWFIQAMALLAVAGMTISLVAGVAEFVKDELRRPSTVERGG